MFHAEPTPSGEILRIAAHTYSTTAASDLVMRKMLAGKGVELAPPQQARLLRFEAQVAAYAQLAGITPEAAMREVKDRGRALLQATDAAHEWFRTQGLSNQPVEQALQIGRTSPEFQQYVQMSGWEPEEALSALANLAMIAQASRQHIRATLANKSGQ